MKPCECGCESMVDDKKRFVHGHHMRMEEYRKKHADAIRGNKNMLGKTHSSATRFIMSQKSKGRKRQEWEKEKVSIGLRNSILFKEGVKKRTGIKLSEEHKEKIRIANTGRICTEETRRKMHIAKLGNKYPLGCKRSDAFKERIREARTGQNNPLYGKRGEDSPNFGQKRSTLSRERMSDAQSKYILQNGIVPGNRSKKGKFYSTKNGYSIAYESTYELKAYEMLEQRENVLNYGRCRFYIPYTYKGENHRYIPDIHVKLLGSSDQILEIKPIWNVNTDINKTKFRAAIDYCATKDWLFSVWTEEQLNIPLRNMGNEC